MKLEIRTRKYELQDDMRAYIEKRMEKFDKMLDEAADVTVMVTEQKNRKKVEVTIPFHGVLLRAEESNTELMTCVDNTVEKLLSQIRKHKTKLARRLRDGSETKRVIMAMEDEPQDELAIARVKSYSRKPYTIEEAVLQMNLLGHDFFAFVSEDSGEVNVVYRRKDGDYGILKPAD